MIFTKPVTSGLALLVASVVAHPGHDITKELNERREFLSTVKRADLSHCAEKLKARGVEDRNVARRSATANEIRAKRALKKRDVDDVLATSHNETDLGYTLNTDETTLFSSTSSCLLTPEVTQGPYYVSGEYVRRDIREDQTGVDTVVDYQVIDVNTCEPVSGVYLEMWHCNATGVYGGIVAQGNGVGTSDESNIDNTWLRGIQATDDDGVAQFETIFPGYYTGRAVHIHLLVHTDSTLYDNGTLGHSTTASHVGQAFFDQDLRDVVEATSPYSESTQQNVANADDSILAQEAATEGVDPIMSYTLLGDTIEDGIFAWLSFGIDTSNSQSVSAAAALYEDGGEATSSSSSGGGGGSGPGGL